MVEQIILPLKLVDATVIKRGKTILDSISLEISPTGLTVVMGPNGSGKSTLLRLMHGLEKPKSGTIHWNGSDTDVRTKQAFVFQTPIMMRRSVADNIAYPLRLRRRPMDEIKKQVFKWLTKIDLGEQQLMEARYLSGGERQKLALARALITNPHVLFLDEPTANLDGESTGEIERILKDVSNSGTRIVLTTHDIGQAKRLANDVVFLNKGKICEQSLAYSFFERPNSIAAQSYLNGDIVE